MSRNCVARVGHWNRADTALGEEVIVRKTGLLHQKYLDAMERGFDFYRVWLRGSESPS